MAENPVVLCEVADGVASVRLNRPDVHNAFNDVLIAVITAAFNKLATDDAVRVVVLSGEGPSFCAGADLGWMKQMKSYTEAENVADSRKMAEMFRTLNEFPKPLIGKVHGAALGGGTGLVAVCDYVLAQSDAKFGFTETRLGIAPGVISPYVLAKIGESQARAWFMSGERFTAEQAKDMALVHEVVKDNLVMGRRIVEITSSFMKSGPKASQEAKKLVQHLKSLTTQDAVMDYTCKLIARLRVSDEGQEGMDALLTKRRPTWLKEG